MLSKTKHAKRAIARAIDVRNGIARQDLAIAYMTIFSPRVRGARGWIERRTTWAGGTVEIAGPELDSTDLIVLLAITLAAGRGHENGEQCQPATMHAGLVVAADGPAADQESLPVKIRIGEVAELIGRDRRAGSAARMIWRSVKRLMATVVSAESESGNTRIAQQLIQPSETHGAWLHTALNWRATRAVLGTGQWAPIDMLRMRNATEIERILMHRLAAHCVGHPLPVRLDRLVASCWTRPASNAADRRKRRQRVREALPNVLPAGWRARVGKGGLVTFQRAG